MKLLLIKFAFIFIIGNPGTDDGNAAYMHTENTGQYNLEALEQIQDLITKKAGAELQKDHKNSFSLNGYFVYTSVNVKKFAPSTYEESFYDIENPDNIYRMRLTKHPNGEQELAVMIKGDEGYENYHAAFDSQGIMFEEDPWGIDKGYSIEIFKIYNKYREIFSQRVDAK